MSDGRRYWICDDCFFRRISELAAIAHVEATGHTVRRGKSFIRPRPPPPRRRRPRYEPEEAPLGSKGLATILVLTVFFAASPFWLPWAQARFLIGSPPARTFTPTACTPSVLAFAQILGPNYPSETLNGSAFRRSGSEGGVADKRALQQSCTITNLRGEQISAFVQVKRVKLFAYIAATYDCASSFAAVNGKGQYPNAGIFCDYVGNIYEGDYAGDRLQGFLHIEIDHDWQAAGFCGPGTRCDNVALAAYKSNATRTVLLDMEGYVYWDEDGWWELHPLTAWSLAA